MKGTPSPRRYFDTLHPVTLLVYFLFALIPAMTVSHPGIQAAAVLGGTALLFLISGCRSARTTLLFALPAAVFCMLINALFTHRGITVLFYFPTGNPCTLESLLSGLSLAAALFSAVVLFAVLSRVMTSEKLICLFGTVSPALALVLSMALRFLPHYKQRLTDITAANAGISSRLQPQTAHPPVGKEPGTRIRQAKDGLSLFSALFAISTEESLAVADAMRARGYGCGIPRSAYTVYRITRRDIGILGVLLFCSVPLLYAICSGALSWDYYPYLHGSADLRAVLLSVCFYSVGMLMPMILSKVNHA
ncbi:MAG: energy-coupling factor transporter transmembrane protein EcfT [Ruminococcaceae bacterium]|nr:energy-coupling factor transporter transmembrane protein EcfT [Oscillospiraceae bacterium]